MATFINGHKLILKGGMIFSVMNISYKKKMDREKEIKNIVKERNILCLYHYTRLFNISSILEKGILSRHKMDNEGVRYDFTDNDRFDGMEDRISLSVGFPNYKTFFKKRKEFEDETWIVLALKPDILWELDCLFNRNNAASGQMIEQSVEYRKSPEAFASMFESSGRESALEKWYTTDVQAEVLVLDRIDSKYIMYVNINNEYDKKKVINELKKIKIHNSENEIEKMIKIYPKLFNNRNA